MTKHARIEAYLPRLYGYTLSLAGNHHQAEDLVQETYFQALKNFDQLKDRERCKYWLFAIMRNLFLKDIEKSKNRIEIEFDSVCDTLHSQGNSPEKDVLGDEVRHALLSAMDKLDERLSQPIRSFYFEGLSYQEIATRLNVPIGTVMSRIARAKVYLKRDLVRSKAPLFTADGSSS